MTLNTIIEEEKNRFRLVGSGSVRFIATREEVFDFLTTAMQRAYEVGMEERDTYWKERVRKEVEFMASKTVWNAEGKPHISAPDLLQALDNLK